MSRNTIILLEGFLSNLIKSKFSKSSHISALKYIKITKVLSV
jgi:hypothetical protein